MSFKNCIPWLADLQRQQNTMSKKSCRKSPHVMSMIPGGIFMRSAFLTFFLDMVFVAWPLWGLYLLWFDHSRSCHPTWLAGKSPMNPSIIFIYIYIYSLIEDFPFATLQVQLVTSSIHFCWWTIHFLLPSQLGMVAKDILVKRSFQFVRYPSLVFSICALFISIYCWHWLDENSVCCLNGLYNAQNKRTAFPFQDGIDDIYPSFLSFQLVYEIYHLYLFGARVN